jgi:hypothetical protein
MELTKNCYIIIRENISLGCSDETRPGYPRYLIFGATDTTPVIAGTVPTAAEMQTYLNTGKAFIIPVSNGTFKAPELQTITGADVEDGLTEVTKEINGATANFKRITDKVLEMFQQNNLNNDRARLWIVDDSNILHGGATGFIVPFYMPSFQHDGFGQRAMITVDLNWEKKPKTYVPLSSPNEAYSSLVNYISEGVYTEVVVATYIAGQVTGYNGITGWTKTTYPTLYLKIATNIITFYPTNADRTAGTNALATVDSGTSLTVTEANASGFGGSLTFVSNAIVDNSTWNVTFTE